VSGGVRWLAQGEAHVPAHDRWLTAPEADRLASMRFSKRRVESRLGRWTAKRAVALATGIETGDEALAAISIRNAPDGAPEVFVDGVAAPVRISMTDRAGWAVAAVSGHGEVGCDLELVEPRSAAFVRDYLTDAERLLVAGWDDPHLAANLVWSAKESALKVLHTGLRRDTRSVEVEPADWPGGGWHSLSVRAVEGRTFPGWWRRFGAFLLTVAAESPLAPPTGLVEPSPLEGAEPRHSWMESPTAGRVP
jgi:4'-phosphopantetheinyl transferase